MGNYRDKLIGNIPMGNSLNDIDKIDRNFNEQSIITKIPKRNRFQEKFETPKLSKVSLTMSQHKDLKEMTYRELQQEYQELVDMLRNDCKIENSTDEQKANLGITKSLKPKIAVAAALKDIYHIELKHRELEQEKIKGEEK